jgi:hypothetical protein
MKTLFVGLLACLFLSGCGASFFACTTEASFNKDGTWAYKSCKNQENMKVKITEQANGRTVAELETTATTPEAAIAAASNALASMTKMLTDLMAQLAPLLKMAAAGAATAPPSTVTAPKLSSNMPVERRGEIPPGFAVTVPQSIN